MVIRICEANDSKLAVLFNNGAVCIFECSPLISAKLPLNLIHELSIDSPIDSMAGFNLITLLNKEASVALIGDKSGNFSFCDFGEHTEAGSLNKARRVEADAGWSQNHPDK
jgi:hypothetical protein